MTPAKHPPRIYVWRSGDHRWRWHAKARNGRVVGAGEQGHRRMVTAVRKAQAQFPASPVIIEPPA